MACARRTSCAVNGPATGHPQRVARPEPPDDERRRVRRGLDRQPAVGRGRRHRLGIERRALRRTAAQRRLQQRHRRARRPWRRAGGRLISGGSSDHNSGVRRDTLLDVFRDLLSPRRASSSSTTTATGAQPHVRGGRPRGARVRGAPGRRRPAARRHGRLLGREPPEWIAATGAACSRASSSSPSTTGRRPDFVRTVRRLVQARVLVVGDDVPSIPRRRACPERCAASGASPISTGRRRPDAGVPITRDDITQIIFTSGATAEPKGVVIRHRNVLANIVPVEREIAKYRPTRAVSPAPLPEPAAAQPHVRPVDGHQHSADGAGTVIFTRSFNPHDIVA
jgi:hypothetical protein